MDEVVGNEANAGNDIDSKWFPNKESGFLPSHESSNMLEMQEMLIPGDVNVEAMGLCIDDLNGKNVARVDTSEQAYTRSHCVDDDGVMVEELTVRNYDGRNLDIGASSTRVELHNAQNNRHYFHQRAEGTATGVLEDSGPMFFSELVNNKQQSDNQIDKTNDARREDKQPASCNTLLSPGGIQTKILSQSGFSQYFVKNTLKGKGIICSGPDRDGPVHNRGQNHPKAALLGFNKSLDSSNKITVGPSGTLPSVSPNTNHDILSLREWLKAGQNKVDKSKSLYIFKQILDLVDLSHSRGEALHALRPSCFKLMPSNQVLYLGSPVQKELHENTGGKEFCHLENDGNKKKELEHGILLGATHSLKRRKHEDNWSSFRRWPQFSRPIGLKYGTRHDIVTGNGYPQDSGYGFNESGINNQDNAYPIQSMSNSQYVSATPQMVSNFCSDPFEEQWYASPEDPIERCSTLSSNIYSLGVLLFETSSNDQTYKCFEKFIHPSLKI